MQLQMTKREKWVYGIIVFVLAILYVEYEWAPMEKSVDVGNYAIERFSSDKTQATASLKPQAPRVAKATRTKPTSPTSGSYIVARGETLYAINRKHNGKVDIKATCALNDLGPTCGLKPGQHITLAMRQ